MSGVSAIRVGQQLPDHYKKMATSVCKCGATFSIIHQQPFADPTRAEKQVDTLKSILGGEHVDPKFQDHLTFYCLDD
jgi:hypothetical protein